MLIATIRKGQLILSFEHAACKSIRSSQTQIIWKAITKINLTRTIYNYVRLTGFASALDLVVKKRCEAFDNYDEVSESIRLHCHFPQVSLTLSRKSCSTLKVNIFPVVKGHGWPNGAFLQHGLPKQMRFYNSGQQCLKTIEEDIADGQSLWYMEAKPIVPDPVLAKKARFRRGIGKILGGVDRCWKFSFHPAEKIIFDNLVTTCARYEYKIDIDVVRNAIIALARDHKWSCITPKLVDTTILWSTKRSLATTRSHGECFCELLRLIRRFMKQGACPEFLLPNVNIMEGLDREESLDIVARLGHLTERLQLDPAFLLTYLGFKEPSRANQR